MTDKQIAYTLLVALTLIPLVWFGVTGKREAQVNIVIVVGWVALYALGWVVYLK